MDESSDRAESESSDFEEENAMEAQSEFQLKHNMYPMRGRPFGIAFVWSNAYIESRGTGGFMIAVNSAAIVAEALQLVGFEVRTRSNMRKKIFMDELAEDKINELRDMYDCAILYLCGRGDGQSYITQDNQRIYISEIHEALDLAGMEGKPRLIIMDFVEPQARTEERLLSEISSLQKDVAGMRSDMEIMELQKVPIPPRVQELCDSTEATLKAKLAEKSVLKKPPSAGITARVAVSRVPIRTAVTKWSIKIHRLGYAMSFGVCDPEGLSARYGLAPLEEYSGLTDLLGNDQFGWAFNQVGQSLHNESAKSGGKPTWGKPVHVTQGDVVTITLDSTQGILSLEVPGKFKANQTKFKHEGLVYKEGGRPLHVAVALFDDGDCIEVTDYRFGSSFAMESKEGGAVWDRSDLWDQARTGPGLELDGRMVRRADISATSHAPDSLIVLCRQRAKWMSLILVYGYVGCVNNVRFNEGQPIKVVPRYFTDRGEARGEKFIGLYDQEAEETNSCTLFSHYFVRRLRGSQRREEDGYCRGLVEDVLPSVTEDLARYALLAWVQGQCGLSGRPCELVLQALRSNGCTIDSIKKIVDKGTGYHRVARDGATDSIKDKLEEMGIEDRPALDATFKCQKIEVIFRSYLDGRRVVFACPPCLWSRFHKSINITLSEDSECITKRGQAMASATVMCALESELRSPRMYGPLVAGGGKHAWDWTIHRLRSSQGDDIDRIGSIRLGIVRTAAILAGKYSIAQGRCTGGTNTTISLDKGSATEDGAYEGMHVVITKGRAAGHISRIYGYTAADVTADVLFQEAPDDTSEYFVNRFEGFEIGDDVDSWALSSSTNGRSAAMHGNPAEATYKAYPEQGPPAEVNRVTAAGYEQPLTYPRFLGNALKEGDVVTAWLDLEAKALAFSLNGEIMGESIRGLVGPVVPAASCCAATDCEIHIGNYRRWAPESGWASVTAEEMGFTDGELEQLKKEFRSQDQGRGGIATSFLREILNNLGVKCTDAEVADIIDRVDADGSGTLDLLEFLQLMARMKDDGKWVRPK